MSEPPFLENLTALLAEFSRSDARELHIRRGDVEVYLSKDSGAGVTGGARQPKPASAPATTLSSPPASAKPLPAASPAALPEGAVIITAPNLGTFYRAPKPGAANYVEIGSALAVGDEVCLIEVMKLFTAVRADIAGRVHAILADDGAMVEAGQPLFAVTRA